jgi:hypothetical protein
VCCERFWRGEEIGLWVGSQSPSEVLRDAEGRERPDGWCAPDLCRTDIISLKLHVVLMKKKPGMRVVALTFMVFIASWACSIVSIASHSVVCGRRSWLMICILSSEVLMEVRGSSAAAAMILCYTYMRLCVRSRPTADPSLRLGLSI